MTKIHVDRNNAFSGWEFVSKKSGGANESGELGGIYKKTDADNNVTMVMIKKESTCEKNISEFLGSQIFSVTAEGHGARVSLIVPSNIVDGLQKPRGLEDDGSRVYVKSEFFKNYSNDMYKDMDKYMTEQDKPGEYFRKDGDRPLFMGTRQAIADTLTKAFEKLEYQSFDKIAPTSLLIGDFDMHTGNIGVIRNKDKPEVKPQLVRIDFAGSLEKLEKDIHPNSKSRHLPGFGPTNHYREFPRSLKNNDQFVKGLLDTAAVDLGPKIDESFKELSNYYNDRAIATWAKSAMPDKFKGIPREKIKIDEIKNSFKEVMAARQESLKEYGLEIKLGLLVTQDKKSKEFKVDEIGLKEVVEKYPDYFNKIASGEKQIKLRDKEKRANFFGFGGAEKILKEKIVVSVNDLKKERELTKEQANSFSTSSKDTDISDNLVNKIHQLEHSPKDSIVDASKAPSVSATERNMEQITNQQKEQKQERLTEIISSKEFADIQNVVNNNRTNQVQSTGTTTKKIEKNKDLSMLR